jgi:hypothetical protein
MGLEWRPSKTPAGDSGECLILFNSSNMVIGGISHDRHLDPMWRSPDRSKPWHWWDVRYPESVCGWEETPGKAKLMLIATLALD